MTISKGDSWIERHLGEIIKVILVVSAVIVGYVQLRTDVEHLKEIRKSDKEDIKESLKEIKLEISKLRDALVIIAKEQKQYNDDNK